MQCACAILSSVVGPAVQYISTLSLKQQVFRRKKNHGPYNMCFEFLHNFCRKHFYSKKKLARYGRKFILFFMWSTLYFCQILIKFEISQQIFEKFSNIKFHENPSSGSRVVPCGQTDGPTVTTKLIVVFRNFANAPIKVSLSNRTRFYFKGRV